MVAVCFCSFPPPATGIGAWLTALTDGQKTLAFGVYPDVSLADAREKRDRARQLLANGVDPTDQARRDKISASIAAANTFGAIADEWLGKIEKDGLSEITLTKIRWLLKHVRPMLGKPPLRKSVRLSFCWLSEKLRQKAATIRPNGCEALARRYSGTQSLRREPIETYLAICAER